MQKFSITEAAEKLSISKEAIYNRIRRGTLKSFEEDGIRYVMLDCSNGGNNENYSKPKTKDSYATNFEINKDKFVDFLIKELEELKDINKKLLVEKEQIYKEKEQILIESKDEIKQIYSQRDLQIDKILDIINRPLLKELGFCKYDVDTNTRDFYDIAQNLDELTASEGKFDNKNYKYIDNLNTIQNMEGMVSFFEFLSKFDNNKKLRKKIKAFLLKNAYNHPEICQINGEFFISSKIDLKELYEN